MVDDAREGVSDVGFAILVSSSLNKKYFDCLRTSHGTRTKVGRTDGRSIDRIDRWWIDRMMMMNIHREQLHRTSHCHHHHLLRSTQQQHQYG
jgi:hypothetical protein